MFLLCSTNDKETIHTNNVPNLMCEVCCCFFCKNANKNHYYSSQDNILCWLLVFLFLPLVCSLSLERAKKSIPDSSASCCPLLSSSLSPIPHSCLNWSACLTATNLFVTPFMLAWVSPVNLRVCRCRKWESKCVFVLFAATVWFHGFHLRATSWCGCFFPHN